MITIAISEVHFTSRRRAGLCRDLCVWKDPGGTDGGLQAGAQWRCKPRVHKGEVTPLEQIRESSITKSSPGNGKRSVRRRA